jgi:transcriptional regulator with XRE-family HTH domain
MAKLREQTTLTDLFVRLSVERYRTQAGWTQTELANQSGIPLRTIQRIANLEHSPKPETLMAIAAAFSKHLQSDIDWRDLQAEPEDFQRQREAMERDYDTVPVRIANSGHDIAKFIADAEALHFAVAADGLTQAVQDEVASFQTNVMDWLDLWSELDPNGQNDAGKHLDTAREALAQHGLTIVGGQTRGTFGPGNMALEATIAVILICAVDSEPSFILRRRT